MQPKLNEKENAIDFPKNMKNKKKACLNKF